VLYIYLDHAGDWISNWRGGGKAALPRHHPAE